MATLQKFKLLATQCAVAGSPTQSPSASPVIHLRRRKTLRMLLNRTERRHGLPSAEIHGGGGGGGEDSPRKKKTNTAAAASKDARVRRKLKDLFVSSPPPISHGTVSDKREERSGDEGEERVLGLGFSPVRNGGVVISRGFGVGFAAARRRGGGSLRPMTSSGFRLRFFRKAWRPVLVSIPE